MHSIRPFALMVAATGLFASAAQAVAEAGPPSPGFALLSPPLGQVVPRNAVIVGRLLGTAVGIEESSATLVVAGQPVIELSFEIVRCARDGGCLAQLRLGELPADTAFDVVVVGPELEETLSFISSADIDLDAPTVPALSLHESLVVGSERGDGAGWVVQREVTLEASTASDATGISGYGLFGTSPGSTSTALVARYDTEAAPALVTDVVSEQDAFGVACYVLSAWDWAGNQGFSEEHCLDVSISEEDAARNRPLCSSTDVPGDVPVASLAALIGLLGLLRRRRGAGG